MAGTGEREVNLSGEVEFHAQPDGTLELTLTPEESHRFVEWVLDSANVATRTRLPGGRLRERPMSGRFISRQGPIRHLRGSDLSERVYVSVEALERFVDLTNDIACQVVAEKLDWRLGRSRRGRPRRDWAAASFIDRVQTVRSLANKYRHPWREQKPDPVLQFWIASFRLYEDWVREAKTVAEKPEGKLALERVLGKPFVERLTEGKTQ